ncbi:methyltransferase domain-containing protein [uncultured Pseudoteredinibacter sp.]|uniref:methyltransferase domain-containing protein n=1 Tax=uncultured Pseudoteredinibacter sp. TaxID=1641701 RepID=UPI00261B1F91|nr:methyltransferase domain-containing protein [uncultured Pseudoteredinibacter sp.]
MSRSEGDRNFDDLVEHFAGKIYGDKGQQGNIEKGRLRHAVIRRDLLAEISQLRLPDSCAQMQVLDIGAGLGQWVIELAERGCRLTYNDISQNMMAAARQRATEVLPTAIFEPLSWFAKPYQELQTDIAPNSQDLILCHALIEWLEEPEQLLTRLYDWMKPGACLSLCHYNPAGKRLRNLVFGNFKSVERELSGETIDVSKMRGGLTPSNPSSIEQIDQWLLAAGFTLISQSGIRVFSDYTLEKRGGLSSPEAVFDMEMTMSLDKDLVSSSRYRHLILRKPG